MTFRNTFIKDLDFTATENPTEDYAFLISNGTKLTIIKRETEEGSGYTIELDSTDEEKVEKKYSEVQYASDDTQADYILKQIQWFIRKVKKENIAREVENETQVEAMEIEAEQEVVAEIASEELREVSEEVKPIKPITFEKATATSGLEKTIFDMAFKGLTSKESQETIYEMLNQKLDELGISRTQTDLVIHEKDKAPRNVGRQHKDFPKVLASIKAGVNLALVGEAGSFKTTTVEKVAEALELPFYAQSVSAQTAVHEFFGYSDANGNYKRTNFREAYEHGGVFLVDEFDAGNPNVLASMNAATANSVCAFADGMIKKHEDFIVVMAGNTFGHGATSEYVGRNKIDAATLDRFAFIKFGYDEDFELHLAPNKDWCKFVQATRKRVSEKKVKTIVSPRATFDGAKLLNAGLETQEVIEMLIYKGLTQDEINLIKI